MANDSDEARLNRALEGVADPAKRETLRKLIVGSAYVAPVVMSFAVDGLFVEPALAKASNLS